MPPDFKGLGATHTPAFNHMTAFPVQTSFSSLLSPEAPPGVEGTPGLRQLRNSQFINTPRVLRDDSFYGVPCPERKSREYKTDAPPLPPRRVNVNSCKMLRPGGRTPSGRKTRM